MYTETEIKCLRWTEHLTQYLLKNHKKDRKNLISLYCILLPSSNQQSKNTYQLTPIILKLPNICRLIGLINTFWFMTRHLIAPEKCEELTLGPGCPMGPSIPGSPCRFRHELIQIVLEWKPHWIHIRFSIVFGWNAVFYQMHSIELVCTHRTSCLTFKTWGAIISFSSL